MPQSLRHIKSRIRSIESTKKLTRAMEMISVSKLKKIQNIFAASRLYTEKLSQLLKRMLSSMNVSSTHPLMVERNKSGKTAICIIASDTGLCGSYNINVLRAADKFLINYAKEKVVLLTVGRKAQMYFQKKGYTIRNTFNGHNGRYSDQLCGQILNECMSIYNSDEVDAVYMIYAVLETGSYQPVLKEKFLNFEIETETAKRVDYITEPDIDSIINDILPKYFTNKIRSIILHAFAAEHHSRTLSMGEATHNAIELLGNLIMQYNKIRQANITNEVIEIIASAEALKR